LKIKCKIWIETENGILISEGRVQLLKLIEQTGSLNKAAKELNMSYQKAWRLIDDANRATNKPLIETKIGGTNGGGTSITPYGKSIISYFESLKKDCNQFLENQLLNTTVCQ
jgi:molybdate transport system regulatory protein